MKSPVSARHSRGSFRPDIEGLRGIAVVLVALFHAGAHGFRGGYIGVDVFFAVSGYLITGMIVKEIEKTAAFSFKNFYARRVRRLLPASGLMVAGVLLAGVLLYSPLELSRYAIWGTYTSLYISNFMFMRAAVNYFAAVTINPFLHTWSLAVEEQFYLLWPGLIVLASWRSRSRRQLAGWLLAVTVLSLAASIWVTHVRQPWAFFSLPTRALGVWGGWASVFIAKRSPVAEAKMAEIVELGGLRRALSGWTLLQQREAGVPRICCVSACCRYPSHVAGRRDGHAFDLTKDAGVAGDAVAGKTFLLMVPMALAFSDLCQGVLSRAGLAWQAARGGRSSADGAAHVLASGESWPLQSILDGEACAVAWAGSPEFQRWG